MLTVLLAQAAPAGAAPADAVAPPAAPLVVGSEAWGDNALNEFFSMRWTQIDRLEWEHVGYQLGLRALFVLVLMTLAWTLSGWASAAVRTALGRVKFDATLSIFLAKLVRWGILLLVTLTCLSYFGVETTSFAAVIGAAGLAIGLAFQGTLSNFAAGAMLLIFRPYKVGDEVNVAGYSGIVFEIELFTTAVDTPDNRRVIIPNSSIFGAVIENLTYHPVRRFNVEVGTAYSADIDKTRAVLERAVAAVTRLHTEPAPAVVLLELAASSINWSVRGWAKRELLGDAKQELIRAIKIELDRAAIGIPYPQLDIHLDPPPEEPARAA